VPPVLDHRTAQTTRIPQARDLVGHFWKAASRTVWRPRFNAGEICSRLAGVKVPQGCNQDSDIGAFLVFSFRVSFPVAAPERLRRAFA